MAFEVGSLVNNHLPVEKLVLSHLAQPQTARKMYENDKMDQLEEGNDPIFQECFRLFSSRRYFQF